jgi:hypothetical protein
MLPNFRWPEPDGAPDEKLIANVQKHGCHILKVFADTTGPEFAYSIGMYLNFGQPEVLIFGLPSDSAQTIINDISDRAKDGERFFAGETSDLFLKGYDVTFVEIPFEAYQEHFGFAMWFYASLPKPFPALQLVWPDRSGKFPWDAGFDESLRSLQPVLGGSPKSKTEFHHS